MLAAAGAAVGEASAAVCDAVEPFSVAVSALDNAVYCPDYCV